MPKYFHYLAEIWFYFTFTCTKETCNIFLQDVECGSESGVDVASNHTQTNLSTNIHAPDLTSPSSVASSGAKPKAGVSTKVIFLYNFAHDSRLEVK